MSARQRPLSIMSLDLSLVKTGVCNPDGSTETLRSKARGAERLHDFEQMICDRLVVLDDTNRIVKYVDVVIIEGYSYHSKGKSFNIGELGGTARLAVWCHDIPYIDIPPTNLKQYATGHGRASKEAMISATRAAGASSIRDDHQADAWWLWQMGLAHYAPHHSSLVKVTLQQSSALEAVCWVNL